MHYLDHPNNLSKLCIQYSIISKLSKYCNTNMSKNIKDYYRIHRGEKVVKVVHFQHGLLLLLEKISLTTLMILQQRLACSMIWKTKNKIRSNANNNYTKENLPQTTSTRDIGLKQCFCEDLQLFECFLNHLLPSCHLCSSFTLFWIEFHSCSTWWIPIYKANGRSKEEILDINIVKYYIKRLTIIIVVIIIIVLSGC